MAKILGEDLFNLFLTMSFNDYPVDGYDYIDENTILIRQRSRPPLIFLYYNDSDWCLTTCKKFIKKLKDESERRF